MAGYDFVEDLPPGVSGSPAADVADGYSNEWAPPGAIREGLAVLVQEPPAAGPEPRSVQSVEEPAPWWSPFGRGSPVVDPTIWAEPFSDLF